VQYTIKNRFFTLFREKAGVISPGHCWVLFYGCYGHYNPSLTKLFWEVLTEFRNDRHLAM